MWRFITARSTSAIAIIAGTLFFSANAQNAAQPTPGAAAQAAPQQSGTNPLLQQALEPLPPLVAGKDYNIVCADGGGGGYEAFPDICRLKDGRLMCVFYAGWQHVSLPDAAHAKGGRVSACFSADEGATWSPPIVVFDGPDDDRDPSVVQLSDGRILCNFFSLRKNTGGNYRGIGSWVVESLDGGATWSAPRGVSPYYCSAPIRELPDGHLIVGLYQENETDAFGAVSISTDKGASWCPPIDIPNGGLRLDAETDVIRLADGKLYAAQRTATESMRFSISQDGGQTWSVSQPMGFPGHSPYLWRTPDNIIVCAHRIPNTALNYSLDECATWSPVIRVDDVGGAYPSMVSLKDGSILIVYYEEGDGSNIRERKFRVAATGLTWIPW